MPIPRPEELEHQLIEMGDEDFSEAMGRILAAVAVACRHHGIVSVTASEAVDETGHRFQLMQDGNPVRSYKDIRHRYPMKK